MQRLTKGRTRAQTCDCNSIFVHFHFQILANFLAEEQTSLQQQSKEIHGLDRHPCQGTQRIRTPPERNGEWVGAFKSKLLLPPFSGRGPLAFF